ncbi:MAG TPA: flagellar assembly protein FliW [Candidatus Wallbacteria bacterium]|nr:flagellar assembly protein FliW [Candidatus Wallbacteria bacterium]
MIYMMIKTKFWGEADIDESKMLTMANGLIGFEGFTKFVMIPHEKDANFGWLQSAENQHLCFLITTPTSFMFDYSIDISDETVNCLGITAAEDVAIYCLVTVPEDPLQISANLSGPLIFNVTNCTGEQVVVMDERYSVKHYIIDELKANAPRVIDNLTSAFTGQAVSEAPPAIDESIFSAENFAAELEESLKVCNSYMNQ